MCLFGAEKLKVLIIVIIINAIINVAEVTVANRHHWTRFSMLDVDLLPGRGTETHFFFQVNKH